MGLLAVRFSLGGGVGDLGWGGILAYVIDFGGEEKFVWAVTPGSGPNAFVAGAPNNIAPIGTVNRPAFGQASLTCKSPGGASKK